MPTRRLPFLASCFALALSSAPAFATSDSSNLTPYDAPFVDLYQNPEGFISGSTWVFNETPGAAREADLRERITINLKRMREVFNVNTVGVYDIVHMADSDRDHFFAQLYRNRQKVVVRIERYDEANFDFDTSDDIDYVMRHYTSDDPAGAHSSLLDYLISGDHLDQVAYFAINMPVDDPKVAAHFASGREDPKWSTSQVAYAREIVKRLKAKLGPEAKLYLSVFYGWDNAYPTPSYAECGADGYFINNYSYPDADAPDETADAAHLINQPRLQIGVDRFIAQYGDAPVVFEHGFHTLEFNGYAPINQNAGLVKNLAAKKKALDAAVAYYQTATASGRHGSEAGRKLNFRGALYFAQNLYKEEGAPPAVCDWVLDYPKSGKIEAEDPLYTLRRGSALVSSDATASGSTAVALDAEGASVSFFNLGAGKKLAIRYSSPTATSLDFYVDGILVRQIDFPASPKWKEFSIAADIHTFSSVTLRHLAGDSSFKIDSITVEHE